ncbi:hypothetical protein J6590_033004 [Homalodisca vitripennis]|nr:hypothetical protein J6590_033004 [Homalodisca vitripennis]
MKICTAEDAVLLQNDLTQVDVWSQANSMTVNLDKSSCITFNRNKSPVLHTYSIRGHALHRSLSVKDLGDVMFLYRLINAELDCPGLLEKINFKASFGTRAMNSFTKVAASSSYAANGPMLRIQRLGNNIPSTLDIFNASKSAIKSRLASL